MTDKRLTKEDILQATDVDVAEESIPEWGGTVLVRALDAKYMTGLVERGFVNHNTGEADMSKLDIIDVARRSIVGDDHKPIFGSKEINVLAAKSFKPIMRVALKAMQLSGMGAPDEGEDGEEQKKE